MTQAKAHGASVVQGHKVGLHFMMTPVYQNHWFSVASGVGSGTGIMSKGVQNEAFYLVGSERFNGFTFTAAVITQVKKHEQVAGFLASLFCTTQNRHRKWIGHIGHHQSNQP